MFKHNARKLAFAMLLVLLAGPVDRALASGTGTTSTPPSTSTNPPSVPPNGVTGTDPEPIEPDIVSLILTLINLG
jgi:hypothetical protein